MARIRLKLRCIGITTDGTGSHNIGLQSGLDASGRGMGPAEPISTLSILVPPGSVKPGFQIGENYYVDIEPAHIVEHRENPVVMSTAEIKADAEATGKAPE